MELLTNMYIGGYHYKKAGVFLTRITSQAVLQPDLFGEISFETYYKQMRLSYTVDAINEAYGRETLFYLVQGIQRAWKMKQLQLSNRYTTRWSEILTAK
jgi:DNA polymerase V